MLTEVVVDVSFGVNVDTACKVKHHSTLLYLCFCIPRAEGQLIHHTTMTQFKSRTNQCSSPFFQAGVEKKVDIRHQIALKTLGNDIF